jgi:hypothetical protein
MLSTIGAVLLVVWLLGLTGIFTMGVYVHALLALALALFLVALLRGRPASA